MSELMLEAVLRMPPNLWSGSEIDVMQRHSRYVQAADELASLKQQLAEAQEQSRKLYEGTMRQAMELAEAKKDAERLVWLEQNSSIGWDINYENVEVVFPLVAAGFNSLTDAIDQAMREGE